MTHVLILADGDKPSAELLERLRGEADLFIAADGAANYLVSTGPAPDVVLGDFDSLDSGAALALLGADLVNTPDQEACDLDKAIAYALECGAARVTVAGAAGGRIDHTLTAASLLLKYQGDADVRIVDDLGDLRAAAGYAVFEGQPGDTLSLVVFEPAQGVTLDGVRWPLVDETLAPGSRGVSNEMTRDVAHLRVRSGVVLVCHLRRP